MRFQDNQSLYRFHPKHPLRFRGTLLLAILLVGSAVSLVGSAGCGSGGGKRTTSSATATRSGRAVVSVRWPVRIVSEGRLVPLAANSIRVTVLQDKVVVDSRLLTRAPGNGSVTTSTEFTGLPLGDLTARAEAFPNPDGSGVLQARVEVGVTIDADTVTPLNLTLGSTIDRVEILPSPLASLFEGKTTTLTATARDAAGDIVLTASSTWNWTSSDPDVATVDARSGLVTAVSQGTTTIEATETESGKKSAVAFQTHGPLRITTAPGLYPAFDPNISDYVVPSGTDTSLQVTVNSPSDTTVSVDGQPFRSTPFTTPVNNLGAGQRFSFAVNSPSGSSTYHVRRLPADFPLPKTERFGTPQSEYYIFAPNLFNARQNYVILADGYGVPIWWYHTDIKPIDAKLLPIGHLAWLNSQTSPIFAMEYTLAGTLVRTLNPAPSIGGTMDVHELLLLPNGNYLFIVNLMDGPLDLRPYGGASNASIIDHTLEEVTPDGTLVWQWSTRDHLTPAETSTRWWLQTGDDPYHMNSVERDGDGYILSLRHLDALIRIDRATGAITWKLGGTPRAESLTFVGDPFGNFGGQHDARILPDGTLTVHDNGTGLGRAPRAARYRIDTAARTATFIEQVTDSAAASSGLVGSARKLTGGNWVTVWGGNPFVTELTPNGALVLRMTFQNSFFTYRADPVPFGMLRREDLRNGMDAQFPR